MKHIVIAIPMSLEVAYGTGDNEKEIEEINKNSSHPGYLTRKEDGKWTWISNHIFGFLFTELGPYTLKNSRKFQEAKEYSCEINNVYKMKCGEALDKEYVMGKYTYNLSNYEKDIDGYLIERADKKCVWIDDVTFNTLFC